MTDVHVPLSTTTTAAPDRRPDGPPTPPRQPWLAATGLVLALTAAVAAIFVAFALPAVTSEPHDVPIGVAGPPAAATQVEQALAAARPEAFDVATYPDADALRAAVLDRDVYGGLALGPDGATLLVASGAGPVVAQALTGVGEALGAQAGMPVTTQDVVPLPAGDSRGAGIAAAALPLTLGSLLPVVALTRRFPGRTWLRVGATSAYALAAGTTLAAVLHLWFGATTGDFWPVALGLSLGIAAISLTLVGLESLAGLHGFAAGAVLMMLVGNPLSGTTSAPELLTPPWGLVGQLLPPGATGTLLRSTAYFDGAGAGRAVTVLVAWVALGLALAAVGSLVGRRVPTSAPAPVPAPAQR